MGKGAVVLELNEQYVVLLDDQGSFIRIPARRLPVAKYEGQHVDLAAIKPTYSRWAPLVAACLALLLLVTPIILPKQAHAWVTLEGRASVEILVDSDFNVLDVTALNASGEIFLNDDYRAMSMAELVDSYMSWSIEGGDSSLLVTSTASKEAVEQQLLSDKAQPMDVMVLEVSPQARKEAGKKGLSAGRALLAAEADTQGASISWEQMQDNNPISVLTDAGADVEEAIAASTDPSTQVDKIRQLPRQNEPGDTSGNRRRSRE